LPPSGHSGLLSKEASWPILKKLSSVASDSGRPKKWPQSTGIGGRFEPEWVSGMNRNHCPLSAGKYTFKIPNSVCTFFPLPQGHGFPGYITSDILTGFFPFY
jgi:hypothetical protein